MLERKITIRKGMGIDAWYPAGKRVRLSTVLRNKDMPFDERIITVASLLPRKAVAYWWEDAIWLAMAFVKGSSGDQRWEDLAELWLDGTDRSETSSIEAWCGALSAGCALNVLLKQTPKNHASTRYEIGRRLENADRARCVSREAEIYARYSAVEDDLCYKSTAIASVLCLIENLAIDSDSCISVLLEVMKNA